jgi:hypothetical protein
LLIQPLPKLKFPKGPSTCAQLETQFEKLIMNKRLSSLVALGKLPFHSITIWLIKKGDLALTAVFYVEASMISMVYNEIKSILQVDAVFYG